MAALDCAENMLFLIPILHQTTTLVMMAVLQMALFLIPILHQTTTVTSIYLLSLVLFLIPILHQTTTRRLRSGPPIGCFSFQFYIKPQPMQRLFKCFRVVSHSNSTSNHNALGADSMLTRLFLIPILHQTTTLRRRIRRSFRCFSFQFYIKPQPPPITKITGGRCFSFQFYIKPQPRAWQ